MSNKRPTKFIFVTGGVISGLGKGLASASIGALLESSGLKVTMLKMDPYINVDPGTMSPFQHGEVFVTDDGGEHQSSHQYRLFSSVFSWGFHSLLATSEVCTMISPCPNIEGVPKHCTPFKLILKVGRVT